MPGDADSLERTDRRVDINGIAHLTARASSEYHMNDTSGKKKNATTGIVLAALTFAVLCASIFEVHPQDATVAKAAHVHVHLIYVGRAPKTANG